MDLDGSSRPADVWQLAAQACTETQLRVLELHQRHGMSVSQIAYALDRDPSTVRGHLRAATRNVRLASEHHETTSTSSTST